MLKTRNVGQEMHRNMQLCSAVGNPYYYTKHHRDCGLVQFGVRIGGIQDDSQWARLNFQSVRIKK